MHKSLIPVTVVCLFMIASACSGSHSKAAEDRTLSQKIETCTNADSLRAYVAQAKDYADKLVNEGKYNEALAFIDSISPVVSDKAPALMGSFVAIKGKVAADMAGQKLTQAADSLSDAASKAVDATKNAASKATDATKDATEKAINTADEKVKDLVGKAADRI